MRPTVVQVQPQPDYMLLLEFDNGEQKEFDAKPYIKGSWFGKLHDTSYFKAVKLNGFSIEWPDGQDICPDDLYYNAKPRSPANCCNRASLLEKIT